MSGDRPDEPQTPPADWLVVLDRDPIRAERCYQNLKRDLTRFLEWQHDDPEAAAQEAIVRGLRKIADGADISGVGARGYLFGFAKNMVKEGWKIRERERPLDPLVAARTPSGARDQERSEARLMLEDVLRLLSRQEREMLFRYISEKDHKAHCEELGWKPGYLRVKVHRLRQALRASALPEREREARRTPRRDAPAIVK